ncbi:hypothetical protein [Selenomonas sp. AB3002]|uniref:hypothetical protein n=1 Tax=Selenomonas sp. AB3002 TaxID=1392502 RepID=UPI0004956E7B
MAPYHYSYALNPEQAQQEARNCKQAIDEAGVLLEIACNRFDMEDADGYKKATVLTFSRENVTAICRRFFDEIKPLDCGVYASLSWFENYIRLAVFGVRGVECTVGAV